jgi:hypothetical protein
MNVKVFTAGISNRFQMLLIEHTLIRDPSNWERWKLELRCSMSSDSYLEA